MADIFIYIIMFIGLIVLLRLIKTLNGYLDGLAPDNRRKDSDSSTDTDLEDNSDDD